MKNPGIASTGGDHRNPIRRDVDQRRPRFAIRIACITGKAAIRCRFASSQDLFRGRGIEDAHLLERCLAVQPPVRAAAGSSRRQARPSRMWGLAAPLPPAPAGSRGRTAWNPERHRRRCRSSCHRVAAVEAFAQPEARPAGGRLRPARHRIDPHHADSTFSCGRRRAERPQNSRDQTPPASTTGCRRSGLSRSRRR